ncbi:uncharacterized protein LOC135939808 [Cloeon dipterum]|uniref:uncharacterized protein LOC135939808 n=1 Tax=Cloeon dipterum TaxID=197152 RepID=UPI00321FF2ED
MQVLGSLPLVLLLLARVQGDLISIKRGNNETAACITSNFESAVAFVKTPDATDDFTKVEYLDDKGKPLLMSEYDCDLVQNASCNKWNKKKDDKITWVTSIPTDGFITDYRWNDLPILRRNKLIKFTKVGVPFHFSILSKNKVKIEVSDGRGNGETIQAVIHRCAQKNSPLIQISDMKGPFVNVTDERKNVLHDCGTWIHLTINTNRTNNTLRIVENENRLVLAFRRLKHGCGNLNCSIAFGDDKKLLVKIHKFSYLYSRSNNEAMTMKASKNTVGFCVDVVFYFGEKATGMIFNLTITQGDEVVQKFTQGANTKSKWVTRRFANESLTLNAPWKLKVTAETPNIYIGGIKFCAGGDYNIVKPKGNHMESCHLLEMNDIIPTTQEKLTKVAGDVILCEALGGNCAEFKACGENGTCVPFTDNTNDTKMVDSNINPPMKTSNTLAATAATTEHLTQPTTTAIIKTTAGETSNSMIFSTFSTLFVKDTTSISTGITGSSTNTTIAKTQGIQSTTTPSTKRNETGTDLHTKENESCEAKTKRLRNMVILTTSWNIGSYTFLVFQFFYYRYLKKLQDSIHKNRRRKRLPTPSLRDEQAVAETSFTTTTPPRLNA